MRTDLAKTAPATGLADRVAAAIRKRTGRRLRALRVSVDQGVVAVSGMAPSYYLKQLALEAARSALRGLPFHLVLEITVDVR